MKITNIPHPNSCKTLRTTCAVSLGRMFSLGRSYVGLLFPTRAMHCPASNRIIERISARTHGSFFIVGRLGFFGAGSERYYQPWEG